VAPSSVHGSGHPGAGNGSAKQVVSDPQVAASPEPTRLVVDSGWVLLAEAEDVGLAHEALARLGELQDRVVVVELVRPVQVDPARIPQMVQEQLTSVLVVHADLPAVDRSRHRTD
jgi:hypothetical protein